MSTNKRTANFGDGVHKGHTVSKREAKDIYKRGFRDFPDEHVYRDPLGFKSSGPAFTNPIEFQKDWGRNLQDETVEWDHDIPGPNRASVLEKWNALQRKGFGIKKSTEFIQKSLGTGDWQLPLDIIQDVFVVNPEQTPFADFVPRVSTQDDEIDATPQTDQPDPSFDLEDNVGTDSDGNAVYPYDDPTYEPLDYSVLGYGVATRTTDKMILASSNLRAAESTQEEAMMLGHRQRTERQAFWGTDATAPAEGDTNGWAGLSQMGETELDPIALADLQTPEDAKETFEQGIDIVQENGAELGNIAIFCGYDTHRTVRRSYEDNERYTSAEDINVGFSTFAMEGGNVPVFKTNAIPRLSNYPSAETNDAAFVVNMDSVSMYQLQDVTLQPLAKLGPEERSAVDQYNVLVSESGDGTARSADHIQRIQVDTS